MRAARVVVLDVTGGLPSLPGVWQRESDSWYTLQARGFNAAANVIGGDGAGHFLAVIVCDSLPQVTTLLGAVMRSWGSLAALLADNTAPAVAVKKRWPTWRVTGTDGGSPIANALRTLTTPIATLTPPFTDGSLSITALNAMAFPRTIAGWADDVDADTGG